MKNAFTKTQKFDDAYFYLDETTIEGQLNQAIELSVALSIKYEVYNHIVKEMTQIEHHCYECRKPIKVDVSRSLKYNKDIDPAEFLCDKHKNNTQISVNSVPYVRYEHVFFMKLINFLKQTPKHD